jgi:hypothetical protein
MITEVEPEEIVVIDKRRRTAKRLCNPSDLEDVFSLLGSRLNPILTQLAKTRRAIFVEGDDDFKMLARFAQKLGMVGLANCAGFAIVPVEGFNPQKIRNLLLGMEATLGAKILGAAILDRDFRCEGERQLIATECRQFCEFVAIYSRKEIENFALVPRAIDRAAAKKVAERVKRSGVSSQYSCDSCQILEEFAAGKKTHVSARCVASRKLFERSRDPKIHEASVIEQSLDDFNRDWESFETRMSVIPGKAALTALNNTLERKDRISLTVTAIIDAMKPEEVPEEMQKILQDIERFTATHPPNSRACWSPEHWVPKA